MTKKHFIALADAIKNAYRVVPGTIGFGNDQLEVLAIFCKEQNPRFDRERWLGYIRGECDSNGGKIK